jgi:predicted esterase
MEKPTIDIVEHAMTVARHARVYALGKAGPAIQDWYLCFHGYGQLAGQFIYKFTEVQRADRLFVVPEALSKFYLDDRYDKIGASWMTREDRLGEIADYCQYLDQVYEQWKALVPAEARLHLIGFSQGCTTLTRWATKRQPECNSMLLWGGGFAEDVDYKAAAEYWGSKELMVIYGDSDPFLNEERLVHHRAFAEGQELAYKTHVFSGAHEIPRPVLREILG